MSDIRPVCAVCSVLSSSLCLHILASTSNTVLMTLWHAVQGFNPWHWSDRVDMSPPCFRRGAVSLGLQLQQWFQWIGTNISKAHPAKPPGPVPPPAPPPPPPPAMFRCIANACVAVNRSGVNRTVCAADCGPSA